MRESEPARSAAPAGPQGATVATPLTSLLDEQNRRRLQGEHVRVEAFLASDPSLRHDVEIVLDLIYNEVRLREENGERPDLDEYRRRFPALHEQLRAQFEVHRAMHSDEVLAELPVEDEGGQCPPVAGHEILGELGRGAMGVVYKARHLRLNRLVAIKMILAGPHTGPRERSRFETEAQAVARLQHPSIVTVHEIGEQDGRPYFCLELVAGGSLAQKLAGTPLTAATAAGLVEALARAVQAAHEAGIVHRDLKPANVLLAPSDAVRGFLLGKPDEAGYFEPKITDFGLARLLDRDPATASAASSEGPVGTPPYMAPEQASGPGGYGDAAGNGRATDIYALGAILYECLTGRPPFIAATVFETIEQVRTLDPVPPRRLNPRVPRDLEVICLACLRKEPQRRYATALDLADDLRRFLEGRPIRQRPAAVWEPAVKWARRRPAAAAWVVLGVVALLGLVGAGLYYLDHRQQWARERAHDRYRQIVHRRDEALFQGTLLGAVRLGRQDRAAVDRAAIQDAARQALALAGVVVEGQGGPVLDPYLLPSEQADVAAGCYDLLLVLAGAVAEPLPGQGPEQQRRQAAEALVILDRAAQLGGTSRAYHLRRARLLAQQQKHEEAQQERRQGEAMRPVSAGDYYLGGVEQYEQGKTEEASRSFREALRLQPNHFEAQCFLAICALNSGRTGEAQVGLTACIGQRPGFAWTYLVRGLAGVQARVFADAEADFATALDIDSSDAVRYAVLANRGLMWLERGEVEKAVADLEAAVRLQPDEVHARLSLAHAYERQKKMEQAAAQFEAALDLRPDLASIYRTRAQFHLRRGKLEAALDDLDAAGRLERSGDPGTLAGDHVERGRVRHLQRRFQDAVQAYDLALRLVPKHALAHRLRGEALLELNRIEEAERSLGRCLEHGGAAGGAFRARGFARVRLGNFSGAVEDYTRALAFQRDADIHLHRGWAYFFSDAWKLAQRDFDEAIRLDASKSAAHVGRGLARVMLGDYRRAVADAEEALRRKKLDAEMRHNVACVFSLASGRARSDAGERDRARLEARYREQAIASLRDALALLPRERRLAFWEDKMRPDSALDPIRASVEFVQLDRQVKAEHERLGRKEAARPR